MMKSILFALATISLIALNSCVQCYNDRYCQDMIGQPISAAIAEIGAPTSIEESANITMYTWFTDQSYTSTHTRPARETKWKDKHGRRHYEYQPAEIVESYHPKKAELTFMCQGDNIINYRTNSDYDMCNTFVPKQWINFYIAADKAAEAAQ